MPTPDFLLHGTVAADGVLYLWIEQTQGHRVVTVQDVPGDTFPPVIHGLLSSSRVRVAKNIRVHTPKGREVRLDMQAVGLIPEQAVRFLSSAAFVLSDSPAATRRQRSAIAPDLMWLLSAYVGIERFVRSGGFLPSVRWEDGSWYGCWILASGARERAWQIDMSRAQPGVLEANFGPGLIEWLCGRYAHWVVVSLVDDTALDDPHPLVRSLVGYEPVRRTRESFVQELNAWVKSANTVPMQVVVMVEEPVDSLWPVSVQVRVGVDAPVPAATLSADFQVEAQQLIEEVADAAPGVSWWPRWPDDCVELGVEDMATLIDRDIAELSRAGVKVMMPQSWSKGSATATLKVRSSQQPGAIVRHFGMDQIVEYDWKVAVDGQELDAQAMNELIHSSHNLVKIRGKWISVDQRMLGRIRQYIERAAQADRRLRGEDTAAASGVMSAADVRALALEQAAEDALDRDVEIASNDPWVEALWGAEMPAPQPREVPDSVQATLRQYQQRGLDWLAWMSDNNVGCILADDMGLGKTLQILALVAYERSAAGAAGRAAKPSIVVCPTSLVHNWVAEAAKFVPSLNVVAYHGPRRDIEAVRHADLVVTTYTTVTRDVETLKDIEFDHVIADEAQAIKNTATKAARAIRLLPARHRIALTGTPVENRLMELRAIMDFCNPGILGTQSFFRNYFANSIERDDNLDLADTLKKLCAPFMLRRMKTDPSIIDDLPDKSEHIVEVSMTAEQAALYQALVDEITAVLNSTDANERSRRKGLVLSSITQIKQICNHPAHYLKDGSPMILKGRHRSGKVEALMNIVDAALRAGKQILVFTQYREFGTMLRTYLSNYTGSDIDFLHGGTTPQGRQQMVERFQQGDAPMLIVSLKAGGTGLNLTAASVVVHMDRWWNPAVENQATDRAYRIGQRDNVAVYKMVTLSTLEESIHDVLAGKLTLASSVVRAGEGWLTELSPEEFTMLLHADSISERTTT